MRDDEADFAPEAEAAGRTDEEAAATRRPSVRRTSRESGRSTPPAPAPESGTEPTREASGANAELGELQQPRDDVTEAEIRERAYELYRLRGGLDGFDQADWFAAEQEVRARPRRDRAGGTPGLAS